MAFIDKPEEMTADTLGIALPDTESLVSNASESEILEWVESRFQRAKTERATTEASWLKSYRNYRGVYDAETQFLEHEQSTVFVKITKTKVLAASAQLSDVLFSGSKFPIGIEKSRRVKGVVDSVHFDPKEVSGEEEAPSRSATVTRPEILEGLGPLADSLDRVKDKLREGDGKTPTSQTFDPAAIAAKHMEDKIQDQLDESNASTSLRACAFELSLFGSGVIKGPFVDTKEYPNWDDEGNYDPIQEIVPKVDDVSVWNSYPDPDARSMDEAEYFIERHRLSRSQLRALKRRPLFRAEAVQRCIESIADYTPESWEATLEDSGVTGKAERYEVLEYWGSMDTELFSDLVLELDGVTIPESVFEEDAVQVNVWICGGELLRLVVNPFKPAKIPYYICPYERNPYSIFGVGLAENMWDTQEIMNGFMRLCIDNAVKSSNLILEVDEDSMVPGQDLTIKPGKIFKRQSGAPGQSIFGTKLPNVTNECMQVFDKARQLTDEATGMPSFAHGSTGVMGVGRTASGMSMLMGAAAQNIKDVVKNIDDFILSPLGNGLFAFNMQFNRDLDTKGDLSVVARGTQSLMRNEVRSQRLIQFMQMSSNQLTAPFIKFDYILRELATSMDLDDSKLVNDPREAGIQASILAEIQAKMPDMGGQGQQPVPQDQAGNVGGNIAPGDSPEPGADGFTGGGGGANGGQPPAQPQGAPQ